MANNFLNKISRNVSADLTAPTVVYAPAVAKKTIVIELDVANSSTAAQTISVLIDDYSARGANVISTAATISSNTIVTAAHGFITGDRVRLTNAGTSTILKDGVAIATAAATPNTDPVFYVIFVSTTSFKLATTHSNATGGTAATITGTTAAADIWNEYVYAYVVREAPVPIGGALKVIAGQKMVLEAQDSLLVTASTANSIDAIASILEDVS